MSQAFAFPANAQGIPTRLTNPGIMPVFRVESALVADQFDPETGLPRYHSYEVVELHSPGDLKQIPVKRVTPALIAQYQAHYDAWKKSGKAVSDLSASGLPLIHWPQLPQTIAASLTHAKVFTVEQLAGLTDTQCQINGAMGIRKYRDMAAAFVEKSAAAAPIAALASKNEALERQVALLTKQVEQVNEVAEALKAEKAPNDIPDLSTPRDAGKKGKN